MVCVSVGVRRGVCCGERPQRARCWGNITVYVWLGYRQWSAYMHVFTCIHVMVCMCSGKKGCLSKHVFWRLSECVGSDQTLAFESCDGCQSNARGRKGLERRQTQT